MRINTAGLDLIKSFEGCFLSAYKDPVGIWTIGYGHTGPEVKRGLTYSQTQAEDVLREDLRDAEQKVASLVLVELTANQFSALVSFVFNVGAGAFSKSTMLKLLNRRDFIGAAAEFARWNRAKGKILPGLTRRRAAEAKLFQTT